MLTQKEIQQQIKYDPDTGKITYKTHRIKRLVGQPAGYKENSARIMIRINSIKYQAGQLAVLYVTGKLPENVKHIDKNQGNLKYKNLKPAAAIYRHSRPKNKPKQIHPKKVIEAIDGLLEYTKEQIAKKIAVDTEKISAAWTQLRIKGYINQSKKTKKFYTTKKGHCALHSRLGFDEQIKINNLMFFYIECCPGNGPEKSYF